MDNNLEKCEPVAEAIRERDRLGFAVVNVIGKLDEIIENTQEVEIDDFLHIAISIDMWNELQAALEDMPKRADLYTSPQPIEKCEPVCNVEGTWLWIRLMDYCKNKHIAPATQNELFAIAGEAHKVYTSPQPRDWVGLSEEDIRGLVVAQNNARLIEDCLPDDLQKLADAITAKLKQLNTKG